VLNGSEQLLAISGSVNRGSNPRPAANFIGHMSNVSDNYWSSAPLPAEADAQVDALPDERP
jgi:hypothetical protein